jgi:FAD:protein FMN transferase
MCQDEAVARLRPAMGTLVAIEARADGAEQASRALAAGYAAIRLAEALWRPTRAASDLARLNRAKAGQRVMVNAQTVALVRLSRELCTGTGGDFEPALPGQGSILHWLPVGCRAVLVRRAARVDLGGIAKGYAIDLAVAALRRAGARSGLVNAGGDLRVFGSERWPVHVRLGGWESQVVELRDCALAASDANPVSRPREHRGYYPGRGRGSALPLGNAAIVAPTAALADALTKVLMFAAPARSAQILARYRARAVRGPAHPGRT